MRKPAKGIKKRSKTIDATERLVVAQQYRKAVNPRTEHQKEYIRSIINNTITFCQGVAGSGKALTLTSKLFTQTGPITMGEVKVGDKIASPDGDFSTVTAIYPQGKKQVLRVYFSNNTHVDCCEEHLWSIYQDGKRSGRIVVNTQYLEAHCRRYDGKRILSIPCASPVNFNRKQYLIDPYTLGILISEGGLTNGNVVFTTCETEILDRVKHTIGSHYEIKTKSSIDHRIVKRQRSSKPNDYKEELKNLGLWGQYSYQKHIPQTYQYGSIDQRISLLQGLMDGDGTISKGGAISYSTTSQVLAQDVCELIYSLGGTTRIKSKSGSKKDDGSRHRTSYRCHISLPNDIKIFFLTRKDKRRIDRTKYIPKLYVDRVERLPYQEDMQCISVDHKENLYLTDHYIPTHNTHIAIGVALEYLLDEKVKKIVITRPVVESGEKIGYLPGSAEEKLHPYLLPLLDEVNHFISSSQFATLKLNNKIDIVPLGLMRGRNFHNAFIVADECQNASYQQLKMLLTRIGMNSKMVLTGDISQSDLYRDMQGGFNTMTEMLSDIEGVGIQRLDFTDIVRNPIIGKILMKLDPIDSMKK